MNNLSDTLREEAMRLHACRKALRKLPADGDPQELIELWKNNLDFALENDFPSVEFIKANFGADLLEKNLIFVDEYLDFDMMPSGVYVINGECSGRIRFAPWSAATVYVRHASIVCIEASEFAKVFVRVYDNAEVECASNESAVIKVYDRRK